MEEDITILTAFLLSNIPEIITQEEFDEVKQAIEKLIKGYRELEKHIAFYEKHGSYKARIIELEEQVEELKNLANNTQWISPCYVAENYIAIEKVDKKIEELNKNELLCKMNFENIKFTIEVLQELKEDK